MLIIFFFKLTVYLKAKTGYGGKLCMGVQNIHVIVVESDQTDIA